MTIETTIEYQPIYSHAVVKSAACILSLVTLLDIMMLLTTYVRYGYFTPFEFHLAPLLLTLLLGTKVRLTRVNNVFKYQILLFGIAITTKKFDEVMRVNCGKFVTLVGLRKGRVGRTYMTELAAIANAMYGSFPQKN